MAPGYYDMVEQSMDYETMTNRLLAPERNGGKYTGLQDMLVRRLRSLLAYGLAGGVVHRRWFLREVAWWEAQRVSGMHVPTPPV